MAALTDAEKAKVRYHMGYPNVSAAASITYGLPKAMQTLFLVDLAVTKLLDPDGTDLVRSQLDTLDDIDSKMIEAQDRLAASALGDLKLREDEVDRLKDEYTYWAQRLSDTLGAPLYPYSKRFRKASGQPTIQNIRMR